MRTRVMPLLLALLLTLTVPSPLKAEDPPQKDLVLPGETFSVNGKSAFIFWPEESKRTTPQPWVLYAPTLPRYPDKAEQWLHTQLVEAGVAVAGIDVGEAYGSPEQQQAFTALYEELTQKRGFAKKPSLLGRSRGGLWASSWAIRNTDKVAGLAGIYPVYDLTTYPKIERAAPAYGMTAEELQKSLGEHNPVAKIAALAKADIPVFIIHGDVDTVVPLPENSATLQKAYATNGNGDLVDLVVPVGQGHNFWPGFFRCQNLVDFSIRAAKEGAGIKPGKIKKTQVPVGAVLYRDLQYSGVNGKPLLLDVYRPKNIAEPVPVVIWVHGGGWKNGSKDRCQAAWLTQHGYAVVSINYALTDEAQWPTQIENCREAVRWVRQNAEGFNLDGDHIGAWGSSAGGHLVALMGTLDAPANEKISSRVQAVCDWFGPTDLLTMPPNVVGNGRTREEVANSNGAKLLGAAVPDVPDLAKQASALYQVSSDDPPFLIMHGDQDPGVPLAQSERFFEALREAGVEAELEVVEGAGHGGPEFQTPEVRAKIREFFDRTLKAAE